MDGSQMCRALSPCNVVCTCKISLKGGKKEGVKWPDFSLRFF